MGLLYKTKVCCKLYIDRSIFAARKLKLGCGASSEFVAVHPRNCVSTMEIQLFAKDRWSIGCPIIAEQISWFKGKDVATSLEYVNARDALQRHVEPEDKTTYSELAKGVVTEALVNQQPHEVYINEAGVYSLIMRSKKPQAKAFKNWITKEVLPSIRSTGMYEANAFLKNVCQTLSSCDSSDAGSDWGRHLYIMRYTHDCSAVKIGRASDVSARRQKLESGHNFLLEIIATCPEAGHFETQVHEMLREHRSRAGRGTEWFNVSAVVAQNAIHEVLHPHDRSHRDRSRSRQ